MGFRGFLALGSRFMQRRQAIFDFVQQKQVPKRQGFGILLSMGCGSGKVLFLASGGGSWGSDDHDFGFMGGSTMFWCNNRHSSGLG